MQLWLHELSGSAWAVAGDRVRECTHHRLFMNDAPPIFVVSRTMSVVEASLNAW